MPDNGRMSLTHPHLTTEQRLAKVVVDRWNIRGVEAFFDRSQVITCLFEMLYISSSKHIFVPIRIGHMFCGEHAFHVCPAETC